MNRKQRTIFLMAVFWSVIIGVPGVWLGREDWQLQLNRKLIAAIKLDDTPAALRALEQGADANTRDGATVTVWQRIWDLIRGRRPMPSTGPTPLLVFLQAGPDRYRDDNPQLVSALLTHGARVDVLGESETYPLWYALYTGKTATARLLIQYGTNVSGRAGDETWLYMAITYSDDAGIVEMMLQRGADSNISDIHRRTPLGMAVYKRNPDTVRCLLRYHANPNGITTGLSNYMSPLQYAETHHLTQITKLLRDAGALR